MHLDVCDGIPADWDIATIDDVCERVTSGGTPSRARPEFYCDGKWGWVKTQELRDAWIDETEERITDNAIENSSAKVLPANTVLLALYGATVGQLGILRRPMTCNQACCAMIVDQRKADFRYIYHQLRLARPQLRSLATGAAQQNLSGALMKSLGLPLPPLPEQKRIAHILGTLDDKIELNRQMNATLEGISRAIFKSWFVDFDPVRQKAAGRQPVGMDAQTAALFPDSLEDSEIGEVPKGWTIAEVRYFLSLSRESVDPSEHPAETFDHYSIPAFDSGCWPSSDVGADIKSQKLLVAPGSVLISKLNPRTPRVWIPQARDARRPVASTEFLVAVPSEATGVRVPFVFCFASSESVVEYLASHASGTSNSHQRVRPDDFLSLRTAVAPEAVLGAFDEVVRPLLQRSSHARSESRTLSALRDTLLPKLLSGEIRVPEAEEAVEEVLG